MNSLKQKYDDYWQAKKTPDDFERYFRNRALKTFFADYKRGNVNALDIAAGDGCVSEFFKNEQYNITLADLSFTALKKAAELRDLKKSVVSDSVNLPFKSNYFDFVFWGDNIEHLLEPEQAAAEIYRILKKGGLLILTTPNMSYWKYRLHHLFYGMVPHTEGSPTDPWEWEHIRFFNAGVIKKLLTKIKFKNIRITGANDNNFQNKLAEKYNLFSSVIIAAAIK